MSGHGLEERLRAALGEAGDRFGLPVGDAELIRLHSNALFAIPRLSLLIRIATNPLALPKVISSVAVTRWLAAKGFPCVVPADLTGHPCMLNEHVVSVWRYEETVIDPPPSASELGRLLRNLHTMDPRPVRELSVLTDPLAGVSSAVGDSDLAGPPRAWLQDRISELRAAWRALSYLHPPALIHGDAHPGNLMRLASGQAVLGDWDHVAWGPREWDLAQVHYTQRRFGRPSPEDIEAFTAAYGWDVRTWPDLTTLMAIRDITGLGPYIRTAPTNESARQELTHRLNTLRENDTNARWHPPNPR
ncbi:aminoglycoside phosphotransferase family protein [Spongiactinospora sp. TRM90649]|uniref:aminoglycoside phosphotransferase family protein n=1 Tax=Spongiactinospora sp. TRM90649 TaxID=3031114 RepID=UPI0023F7716F|nr:aminoglycoside phosphotransferase family protein [Spongiactinospora sp. TRM90649]MDF5751301.1 aminoglycoside phosphotransferase family protein [Spongiactinospora sp. TRM90649]